MRLWITLFDRNGNELLGSDSCVPLDGRCTLRTAHREALAYCERLRNVKPHLGGYIIQRGERPSRLFPLSSPVHIGD